MKVRIKIETTIPDSAHIYELTLMQEQLFSDPAYFSEYLDNPYSVTVEKIKE